MFYFYGLHPCNMHHYWLIRMKLAKTKRPQNHAFSSLFGQKFLMQKIFFSPFAQWSKQYQTTSYICWRSTWCTRGVTIFFLKISRILSIKVLENTQLRVYLIGQYFGGQNFRWTKFFGGQNFRHQFEISAVLSAENVLSVLCFSMNLIFI